jgi:phage protein U
MVQAIIFCWKSLKIKEVHFMNLGPAKKAKFSLQLACSNHSLYLTSWILGMLLLL